MTDISQMKDLLVALTASSNQAYDAPFETILTLQRQCQKYHKLMVEIDGADESNWTFLQKVKEQELRLHDTDKPSSTMFYLWEKLGGTLVWMDVVMDFNIAWQMVQQCWNVGLALLPAASSRKEFFIMQHYAHMTDEARQNWLYMMNQLSKSLTVPS